MSDLLIPRVSVIITAYDRKKYLINAIKTVLNQDMPRDAYEIIVSKNYEDNVIDNFMLNNNIISIVDNVQGIGPRLANCIPKSTGKVLCFLEDDDLWEPNRLSIVTELFSNEPTLGYFHNAYLPISETGNETREWIHHRNIPVAMKLSLDNNSFGEVIHSLKFSPNFNLSSISISRKLAMDLINNLPKILFAVDTFFYIGSLFYGYSLKIDDRKLTKYTIHKSNMNLRSDNFKEFISTSQRLYQQHYTSFKEMLNIFDEGVLSSLLTSYLWEWELRLNLVDEHSNRSKMLHTVINGAKWLLFRRDYAMFLYFLATVFVVFPFLAKRIYYFYLINAISKF